MIDGTRANRRRRSGRRAALGRHRRPRVVLLLVAVVAVTLLAPMTPASADPVASTINVSTGTVDTLAGTMLYPVVTAAVAVEGVVVLTEGATELARDTLSTGSGYLHIDTPVAGPRTFTVSYLGSDTVAPSSTTFTLTIQPSSTPTPVTGTLGWGSNTATLGEGNLANAYLPVYDAALGTFRANATLGAATLTADVAGHGPSSIVVRPYSGSLDGTISPAGVATFGSTDVSFWVTLVTDGGQSWSTGNACMAQTTLSFTGAPEPGGLALHGTAAATTPPIDPAACKGRGDIVNSILAGPLSLDLHVTGSFPAPPPSGTVTTTTLDFVGPATAVGDQGTVRATVTTAGGFIPVGSVYFYVGSKLIDITYLAGGVTTVAVDLDAEGPLTVTAYYQGYSTAYAGSTGSTTFTVTGPPPGRPATGSLSVGTNPTAAFPVGLRLTGADFDPVTGDIGSSSFWFPTGWLSVDTGIIGTVQVKYRISQTAPITGHVAADGTVTFDSTALVLQARSYGSSPAPTNQNALSNCTFGPIPMTLTGTADAGGLHLHADDTMIPPLPSTGCSGLAAFINPRVAVSTDLAFEVEGDFRRFAPATPVTVATYFPSVAQYNQSYFVAHVGTDTDHPTGEVTFRDGATVLGTAPIGANGYASLVASMDQPGTRTITAAYDGDTLHGPGSDTTTVDVSPAPTGLPLDGNLTVSGNPLGIGAGSTLVPATGNSGAALSGDLPSSRAALWFTPTTVPLDLPGYGPAQVEVRLFQYGQLSATTVGRDGTFNGLSGMFVLQVRKVTTATGTTIPIGCVNLVLLGLSGQLTYTDVDITSTAGGAGRIPLGICTGPGQAAITKLAGGPVTATLHAPL